MHKLNQKKTPYLTALKKYLSEGISPFDVPTSYGQCLTN